MVVVALALVVAAAPSPVLLAAVQGSATPVERRVFQGALAAALDDHLPALVSSRDVEGMLELEGEKQLAGCEDAGACLARLQNTLGADRTVLASLDSTPGGLQADLVLMDARSVTVVARAHGPLRRVDDEDALEALAATLVGAPLAPAPALLPRAAIVGGVIGVALGGGAILAGALPALDHADAAGRLKTLRGSSNVAAAMDDAAALQDRQQRAGAAWASWGSAVVVTGVVVAGAGAVASVVGATAALSE